MINTLNAVTVNTKGLGHDQTPLTQQLAKRADANGDGTISSTEFSAFMQELMARLEAAESAAGAPAAGSASAPATSVVESKGAFTPPSAATAAAIASAARGLGK